MTEFLLLLPPPQDVSTHYRSVDMTVLAAFATGFCQKNSVSLCKGTKLQKAALFAIVCRFPLLPPLQSGFAKDTVFLSAKAQKLQNSAFAEFWDSMPVLALECFSAYGTGVLVSEFSSAEFGALARGFW